MTMKKAKIDGKIVDVVERHELSTGSNLPYGYTGIELDDYVLPLRAKNDTRPGVYRGGNVVLVVKKPNATEQAEYSKENIIDFGSASDMKDLISKQNALREMERSIVTTVDNIFCPQIRETDAPEMVALKKAVAAKGIDIDKYESRFGANFNNDKRLFDKSSITLSKLKSMCNALDINATLILSDSSEEVPNPMREKIVIPLTDIGGEEDV